MSSTNRGSLRHLHISDYYITPIQTITLFLDEFIKDEPNFLLKKLILDPCAGGQTQNNEIISEMSYPKALKKYGFINIDTLDIRADSLADMKTDYLQFEAKDKYDVIITNPPFAIAFEIIKKAIDDVKPGGYVIMLERLNFLESKKRKLFWNTTMPKYIYVNSGRISFDGKGSDSIVYAHFVWQKGLENTFSLTKVI